ncbi:uncharacterized protein LOC133814106 [Humulus lupulus]|uniref:uncharacterized protein LOC133814106 n=1 Tax=Humulus lupulus TaxID=3486 RepID=UPI002B403689|nr:uncharacterized protein LOC133814106 [Humulus lupulus]
MGALYQNMFQGWCFTNNLSHHPNGRIVIAWNPNSFDVDIKGGTSQYIHCELKPKIGDFFALTVVYVVNDSKGREQLWKDLVQLSKGLNLPWIVGGDFNSVLNIKEWLEYRGNANEMIPFQNCITDCGLEDIKFNGNFFTWNNKQEGKDRVYAKLDRFLANHKWLDKYTTDEVTFFPEGEFDHSPDLLSIYSNMQNGKKPFRYFNFWKNLDGFIDTVNKNWNEDSWYSYVLSCFPLEAAQNWFKSVEQRRQGKYGDLGSNQNGRWIDDEEGAIKAFLEFYHNLLGSCGTTRTRVHKRIVQEGPMVTQRQSNWLLQDYTKEEVKDALQSIPDDKAQGPDGFSSAFFKDTWEITGSELTVAVLSFLNSRRLLKEINATTMTLIPKSICPESVNDYRPIACCNVIYKITSKMICKRLREVLTGIISKNQSGFFKGRQIAHNIMIFQDMVQGYNRRSAKSTCLFKIDLQKAYDTLD